MVNSVSVYQCSSSLLLSVQECRLVDAFCLGCVHFTDFACDGADWNVDDTDDVDDDADDDKDGDDKVKRDFVCINIV